MTMRQFHPLLQNIIVQSGLNLNNISQASGISNGYLAKLMRGNINRPGKDKLASILLSLNYTITKINDVLSRYDYQPLHTDDIPTILKNNSSRKIVGGNLPQYDHIYYDLLLVVLEKIGGNKILVKSKPSQVFMPHELYLMKEYPYESNDEAAVFRYSLTQAILVERSNNFIANLQNGYCSETYICSHCFSEYLERQLDDQAHVRSAKRDGTIHYLANAISLSLKQPEQHQLFFIERCPYYHFMIQDADGTTPKVTYPGRKLHSFDNEYDKQLLEGFTTDLPHIVAHFRHEVDMSRKAVSQQARKNFPQSMCDFIFDRVGRYGLQKELQNDLDQLMKTSDFIFF